MKHGIPDYMRKMLSDHQPETVISLRSSDDPLMLFEPRCSLQLGFRAFKTSAPRLFNKLPREIKESTNVNIFKKKLKTYLFSDCYNEDNEINEFYKL